MLPDYPNLKNDIKKLLRSRAEAEARDAHQFLSKIPKNLRHEGNRHTYSTVDGVIEELDAQQCESAMSIPFADFTSMTLEDAQRHLTQAYCELHGAMTKRLFEVVDEAVMSAGNAVSGNGGPLTQELFLEAMGRVHMDLDDMSGFCLVAHPSMKEKMEASFEEWSQDPEFQAKWKELQFRKRSEWLDSESRRKLVD